jgi:hypothetical protein
VGSDGEVSRRCATQRRVSPQGSAVSRVEGCVGRPRLLVHQWQAPQ